MVEITSSAARDIRKSKSRSILGIAQRALVILGAALLAFYGIARIHGVVTLHAAMRSFEESKASMEGAEDSAQVDYSLWSAVRIKAYKAGMRLHPSPPLAVLRIPKLRIVAPVMDGIGDLALNTGVGRIPGTSRPGEQGNIGIAGHRDGFFRGLKDIAKGDTVELVTKQRTDVYVVDAVHIVGPHEVGELRPGSAPAITLVTCYPFYFAGSAPKRYIVHASFKEQGSSPGR